MAVHGIDLGTTYSAIARTGPDGRPEVLAGMAGEPTTPSVVLFASPGEQVVGEGAGCEARLDPEHVCMLVNRRVGDTEWRFVANGKAWSAPGVSALILRSHAAAFATGDEPTATVITVPAYFGDEARRATMLAGTYAGLDVLDVLSEPIAAALAYGSGRLDGSPDLQKTTHETVPVYDRGGGTFDATVLELADRRISVLAAERAKHQLTDAERTDVVVAHDGARSTITPSRADLEEMTTPLSRGRIDLARGCLGEAARRGGDEVDRVLLVGGSSRMPAVTEAPRRELDLDPRLHDPGYPAHAARHRHRHRHRRRHAVAGRGRA